METLTLARFLCEMTLQEYDYARESPSKLAASCLLLALIMKNLGGWVSACPTCAPPQGTTRVNRLVCEGDALGLCSGLGGWRGKMMAVPSLRGPSSALLSLCRPPHWSTTAGTAPRTCTPW